MPCIPMTAPKVPIGLKGMGERWENRRDPVEQGDKEMPEFVTEENGHDTSHVDHPLLP